MKAIILLHGALGSAASFDSLTPELSAHYTIYRLELSGHGNTPFNEKGFDIAVFAKELDAFIVSNKLNQPMIFGYSMGGYVALYLEVYKPGTFEKIITLGTKFSWSPDTAKHEVSRLNPTAIEQKVPAFAKMLAKRHAHWKDLMETTAQMMLGLGDSPSLSHQQLTTIQIPVSIIRGDMDQMVSKEESENAATALTSGTFIELKDTPHPIEKIDPKVLAQFLID